MKRITKLPVALGQVALGVLWLMCVGAGLWGLWSYASSPGQPGKASRQWPAESRMGRPAGRARLVMFAHPQCPCTRASLRELEILMTRFHDRLSAKVVFVKPAGFTARQNADWPEGDLWQSAAAIPGVVVVMDESGFEARSFGAVTSGQTYLYNTRGQLMFSGGITGARGHSGDNPGRGAVESLLATGSAEGDETHVFGCAL